MGSEMQVLWLIIWIVLLLFFITADLMTSNVFFIGFVPATIVTIVLNIYEVHWLVQVGVMVGMSIATFIFMYPKLKRMSLKKAHLQKTYTETFIGQTFVLTEDCERQCQQLFHGIYWTFINQTKSTLLAGTEVEIISREGNKLAIQAVAKERE